MQKVLPACIRSSRVFGESASSEWPHFVNASTVRSAAGPPASSRKSPQVIRPRTFNTNSVHQAKLMDTHRGSSEHYNAGMPLAFVALFAAAGASDVPLTLEENSGVRRVAEPVTFGVPLPKGLVRDTARLRLYVNSCCLHERNSNRVSHSRQSYPRQLLFRCVRLPKWH